MLTILARKLDRLKWRLPALLGVVILGLLVVQSCASAVPDKTVERIPGPPPVDKLAAAPEVGRRAPDFTLTDLDGKQIRLSDLRGKVVFINFWATWCPPCRAEMPEIEAFHQEYKSKDVVVIGVDILESENVVRKFVEQGGYTWTFVIDTTGEVSSLYKVNAIPASYFIDREGVIRAVNIGAMTKRAMEAKISQAM